MENNRELFLSETEEKEIMNVLFSECYIEDVSSLPETQREEYITSDEAVILERAKLIQGKTRIRMSKMDDLTRRIGLASILIGKHKNDPLYVKFTKHKALAKLYKKKLINKNKSKALKLAKTSQKNYLKKTPLLNSLKNKFNK